MAAIAEFECSAKPSYRVLVVRDSAADATDELPGSASAAYDPFTSNTFQVCLHSLQQDVPVMVQVAVWDSLPAVEGNWDGAVELRLHCETGLLLVEQLTVGYPGRWALPEAGTYDVLARWRGREEVAGRIRSFLEEAESSDLAVDEYVRRFNEMAGTEIYRLDLCLSADQLEDDA